MKRILFYILVMIPAVGGLVSCHDIPEYADNPQGNFEALWTILDEHYSFFSYKDVDWQEMKVKYGAKISPTMTDSELFRVCSDMLKELKDGHTNLSLSLIHI